MNNKITTIKRKRQSDLITICQRVIERMENNPAFPNPPAALADLKKALPEYQAALANAQGRDKIMVSIKNDKKAIVVQLLSTLADYVTVISNGDRTLLLSSGFDVTGEGGSTQPLAIEKLVVELGQTGEATTRIKNATAAIAFVHQYATESPGLNTAWTSEGSSFGYYRFEGLTSDKRYWFRVVAIGRNGQRAYSPVVSRVIQ